MMRFGKLFLSSEELSRESSYMNFQHEQKLVVSGFLGHSNLENRLKLASHSMDEKL